MKRTLLFALTLATAAAPLATGSVGVKAAETLAGGPNDIAPTVATAPHHEVKAAGAPRVAAGHPNTLWDQTDIERMKALLRTNAAFRTLVGDLKSRMDERIGKPIDVPPPQKGPDGAWLYPGDYFPDFPGRPPTPDPVRKFARFFARDSEAVASLGLLYALTGDERYAKYARDLLIAYANLPRYGASKAIQYRYARGLSDQVLGDALGLETFARGYDLIYNAKALSAADRVRVHDELIQPLAWVMLYPEFVERDPGDNFMSQANNRGAIGAAAVLIAGYATDDQELVNAALYGTRTTLAKGEKAHYQTFPPPKDWVAATADHPSKGLLTVHLAKPSITGGMWVEGTPGYSLYALTGLVNAAEAAWRHGLDLYGQNDAILKYVFDFPLLLAYPDMSLPGENDSRRLWLHSLYYPALYEYGWSRYRDPHYLSIINPDGGPAPAATRAKGGVKRDAEGSRYLVHSWLPSAPPSFLFDLDPREKPPQRPLPSVNFPAVGYGVLRVPAAAGSGVENLTLSYGPPASHGHPDKLHIDLWALDDILMPSPGVQFPYDLPMDAKWHWTTLAHNTLTVDETSQWHTANPNLKNPARADQSVFGPGETIGVQRAWSDNAYPGVTMDRALCLTGDYLADLFAAFSDAPHKYDLAWHVRGEPSSDLALADAPFPEPVANGYNAFTEVRRAPATSGPWSIAFRQGERSARLIAAGGTSTEPILGLGGVYADAEPNGRPVNPTAPTVIERRDQTSSTIFGNVLDYSGGATGAVKSVSQLGGRDSGFGLLRIETAVGEDLCYAAYRSGPHTAAGLETDALQALVQRQGAAPHSLYLGGGTSLKVGDAEIRRSAEGLAYIEATREGGYVVGNPSPTPATVTVTLKGLQGLKAFTLNDDGQAARAADVAWLPAGGVSARLEAGERIGLFPSGRR